MKIGDEYEVTEPLPDLKVGDRLIALENRDKLDIYDLFKVNVRKGIFTKDVFMDLAHCKPVMTNKANDFLARASTIMQQRAKQYDKPDGERSMDATIKAFNAVTGRNLTESDGWLLMLILKNVRQWQKPDYHADSAEDAVAYSALLAEALAAGK